MSELVLYASAEARSIEKQLDLLTPRFAAILGKQMDPARLIRTIMISLDRTPKLLRCDRQTIFNAALSAACLGLEVDGVTGQAFMLPFKEKAQLVTGYKGYNTLAARGTFSIRGAVVREGDLFEYEPTNVQRPILHRPKLGNEGRIIYVWALAVSHTLPALPSVLTIDEVMDVKRRAPGAKTSDSPWNDPKIGFVAMAEKTSKRRLGRSMPLNILPQYAYAARMDEAFEEQGLPSRVVPLQDTESGARTVVVEGDRTASPLADVQHEQPSITVEQETYGDGPLSDLPATIATKVRAFRDYLSEAPTTAKLDARWIRRESAALKQQVEILSPESLDHLAEIYEKRRTVLAEQEESARSNG